MVKWGLAMMTLLKNSRGFSLMELMVTMAIFGMIVAAIITARTDQQGQHVSQIQAAEMQQSVRAVMFMIKRDIMKAGFNPISKDEFDAGITLAQANSLTFSFVNINNTPETLDPIAYALVDDDGDGISEEITRNGIVIAENIQALTFTYFDGSTPVPLMIPAPVATPASIRSIQISITARIGTQTANNTRTLTSAVNLRN